MPRIQEGSRVQIFEGGEKIDEAIVRSAQRSKSHRGRLLVIESTGLYPGVQKELGFVRECGGWKIITEGLGGERAFSQRGPVFDVKLSV